METIFQRKEREKREREIENNLGYILKRFLEDFSDYPDVFENRVPYKNSDSDLGVYFTYHGKPCKAEWRKVGVGEMGWFMNGTRITGWLGKPYSTYGIVSDPEVALWQS